MLSAISFEVTEEATVVTTYFLEVKLPLLHGFVVLFDDVLYSQALLMNMEVSMKALGDPGGPRSHQ